ncbi:hypothetical protein GEMRC1_010437 [Eukaryota sp. GEM-RC1]
MNIIHIPQTLVSLICLNSITTLLDECDELYCGSFYRLRPEDVYRSQFFLVSKKFFMSAISGIQFLLDSNTIAIESADLYKWHFFSSFFGVQLKNVVLADVTNLINLPFPLSSIRSIQFVGSNLDFLSPSSPTFLPRLKHVHIQKGMFTDNDVSMISATLRTDAQLISLYVAANYLNNAGANQIFKNCHYLQQLNLGYNNLSDDVARAAADYLARDSCLLVLDLSCNSITCKGISIIAKPLEVHPSLKTLSLTDDVIKEEGAVALAKVLEVNSSISELNLCNIVNRTNAIKCGGLTVLAKSLEDNCTLASLYISSNLIADEGVIALGSSLLINQSLEHLDLYDNQISDDGVCQLALALQTHSSLSLILLSSNLISDVGAMVLAEALKTNASLTLLQLNDNRITSVGAGALMNALRMNCTLTGLSLYDNLLSVDDVYVGDDVLDENDVITALVFDDCQSELTSPLKNSNRMIFF